MASHWRDFGLVNEDFVVCFLKTFLVFSGLAFLVPFNLFQLYLRPDYFFCVGLRQEPKTALQLLRLNPVLRASYVYCFLAWAYIRCRRDALNDLQQTTRDSWGLPRNQGPHPSNENLASQVALILLMVLVLFLHSASNILIGTGQVEVSTWRYLLPAFQVGPQVVLCLGLPGVVLLQRGRLSEAYRRELAVVGRGLRTLFQGSDRVHPVQE